METLGSRLKYLRTELDLGQSDVAELINASMQSVSNFETNRAKLSSEQLLMLVKKTKVNANWLLTGEGEMFANGNVSQSIENSGNNNKLGVVDIANNYGKRENELALENAKLRGQLEEKEAMINKFLKIFGK